MLKMRESYRERRNVMVRMLNDMGLKCIMPQGAFYAFPNIQSTGLDSKTFARRLLEQQHVAVVPGIAFGECGEGYIRCCYATGIQDIIEAMNRMKKFVDSLKK
jgi:aminotransferase